jgi:hippurate hydrolase
LHITASLRSGVITTRPGAIMASADVLRVRVLGRGGHAALPHDALDPIPAAAAMVGALQTMVTRRVNVFDPAVVSVTRIAAGTTSNVIPDSAELEGTIRAMSETTRTAVHTEVARVCAGIAAAHGCTAEVTIEPGYPVTVNDERAATRAVSLAEEALGRGHGEPMSEPIMGAEDFAYVLSEVPGAIAFLGACPPGAQPPTAAPNHSDKVLFDESALASGVAMYSAFALDTLR